MICMIRWFYEQFETWLVLITGSKINDHSMQTYILILRGINVSGQKLIEMAALRSMFEKMGFKDVNTYLQSGNIVFNTEAVEVHQLEQMIYRQIKADLGLEVPVIVMSHAQLHQAINQNPFLSDPTKAPSFLHLTFLASAPEAFDQEGIERKIQGDEAICFSDRVIYLYCPNGYGRTKLTNNFLESRLKVTATTRNWKTVNELQIMANSLKKHYFPL